MANPVHIYADTGDFVITLIVRHIDMRTDTSWLMIHIDPSPLPMLGPDLTICTGDSITFDAGVCSGCSYLWDNISSGQTNIGHTQTYTARQAGVYTATVTGFNGCSESDTVALSVTTQPVLTTSPLFKDICSGQSTSIGLSSNVPNVMFYWTAGQTTGLISGFAPDSGLAINQTLVNHLLTPGVVTYSIHAGLGSCVSDTDAFAVSVLPSDTLHAAISASATDICTGTLVTFICTASGTAEPLNYQWKVNNVTTGSSIAVFAFTPNDGDTVQCIVTSTATGCTTNNPATSNVIVIHASPILPVSISVNPSANPMCASTMVNFTTVPVNGGITPQYQWKVNSVNVINANNPVFSYVPLNGDMVTCSLLSSENCISGNPAISNTVIMAVNPNLPVGVSILASSNPFCSGSSVTYTASPVNGGTTPGYQWKVNGLNAGTNSSVFSYNPANGDQVTLVCTSSFVVCTSNNPATSNTVTMLGTLSPFVTFTPCFDTITTVTAKPFRLKCGLPLGGTYSGSGVNSLAGVFNPALAGVGTHTLTYAYTNAYGCEASTSVTIVSRHELPFTCGNTLTDIRDGKSYPTVQIGTQCWMASNLEYGMTIDEVIPQTDNCMAERYVRTSSFVPRISFYQWDELMQYQTTEGSQGLCPPGWHVPTETEWTTLTNFYSGSSQAGRPLQDTIISGFKAHPDGVFYLNSSWNFAGLAVLFWTSTPWDPSRALSHGMNSVDFSVSLYPASRANAFPVRCLRD